MKKYISLYELLNMVRGIETLMEDDDSTFLKERYVKIKAIYDECRLSGNVPRYLYTTIVSIDGEILEYIGVE